MGYTLYPNQTVTGPGGVLNPNPGELALVSEDNSISINQPNQLQLNIEVASTPPPSTLIPYNPTILAEPSLMHFYPMNEPAGSSSLADIFGAGPALSVISNSGGSGGSNVGLLTGDAPLTLDFEHSVRFPNNDNPVVGGGAGPLNYILVPAGVWSPIGGTNVDFTFEILVGDGWFGQGSEGYYYSGFPMLYSAITGPTPLGFECFLGATRPTTEWNVGGLSGGGFTARYGQPSGTSLINIVSSGGFMLFYVNAQLASAPVSNTGVFSNFGPPNTDSWLGLQQVTSQFPWQGRMSKLAIYNAALSQAQIAAHFANIGQGT